MANASHLLVDHLIRLHNRVNGESCCYTLYQLEMPIELPPSQSGSISEFMLIAL